jgi:hypothetical protein
MYSYVTYGLGIHSTFPLPELTAREGGEPDVTIRMGKLGRNLPRTDHTGSYFDVTPKEAYLFWEQVGGFLVRDGREITVEPLPGVEEQLLRLPLLGAVLSAAIHQRGYLGLHASAVAINGQAVAFVGASGEGKSTTAATLYGRGHAVLADDLVVISVSDGTNPSMLHPSFPQLKLFPEAAAASLGDDPEVLPQLMAGLDKRARHAPQGFTHQPLPLRCIYILETGPELKIEPLPSQEKIVQLIRQSYGARIFKHWLKGATAAAHFRRCAALADSVSICRLIRPRALAALGEMARLVEDSMPTPSAK